MTTEAESEYPIPKTLVEYIVFIKKIFATVPADDLAFVRKHIELLQRSLFSIGHYFMELASPAEIHAIAISVPWHESLSWMKTCWFEDIAVHERAFLDRVEASFVKDPRDPGFARSLVLARLFLVSYRTSSSFNWRDVPPAYLRNLIEYYLEPVPLVCPGDGIKYTRHMEQTLRQIRDYIRQPDIPPALRNAIVDSYMKKFTSNHLMMSGANLLPVMRLRNEILQFIAAEIFHSEIRFTPLPRNPKRKIRLGIISKTVMAGGETWAMVANISALDKNKYEIIVFYFGHDAGYTHNLDYYRELGRSVDRIVPLPAAEFGTCVAEIRKHDIDILWHQSHYGLMECSPAAMAFTHKLARVECAMFAMHAATTGNPHFDYFINVEPAFPPKTWANEFSEKEINVKGRVIYMPEKWDHAPNQTVTRKTLGIPADAIVYFGGAAFAKYNGDFLTAWLTIIKNVPNSYLIVYPFNPAWMPETATVITFHIRLQEALNRVGVSADRIRIVGNVNGEAIIRMHEWGHIYLDSFPYGGVTSLNDAIRGGLCPIVSVGQSSLENGDANILASYGLKDLLVRSPEEYVETAIRCGIDEAYREKIRARVRQAWDTKRQGFWSQVGASYADVIEQIVEEKFGDASAAASADCIALGGR